MKINGLILILLHSIVALCWVGAVEASPAPLWTFTPLTPTTLAVASNATALVQYQITNQSNRPHTLIMQTIPGITQLTSGLGICGNPFILAPHASCILSLQVNGSQLILPINDGPIVADHGSPLQQYRPAIHNILHITQAPPITTAIITVTGSPLTLTTHGSTGTLTVNNTSLMVPATNVQSDFTATALDGNVAETGNTCAILAPQANCTLTYTAGNTPVSQTDFPIEGSNTNRVTAAIQINIAITLTSVNASTGSASGGAGVTLTGTGLTGATGVTFGGNAATSVHVVNSTTVTAVTPPHAVGNVDVVITTPSGSSTLTHGYTYQPTAIGQSAYGGNIACLNGGLNNLIAAITDNVGHLGSPAGWGGSGTLTNATSTTDGASNTATIVSVLGNNGGTAYAAALCDNYEIDSQGNTPCESANTCYNDWFLPAGNNTTLSGQLHCLYTNQVAIGGFSGDYYWSSTEIDATNAWSQRFSNGQEINDSKTFFDHYRCVRSFNP